jgi:hypothetical protein
MPKAPPLVGEITALGSWTPDTAIQRPVQYSDLEVYWSECYSESRRPGRLQVTRVGIRACRPPHTEPGALALSLTPHPHPHGKVFVLMLQ